MTPALPPLYARKIDSLAGPSGRIMTWTGAAADVARLEVVVLPPECAAADAERAAEHVRDDGAIVIRGAEHPKFDAVKQRFIELGHIGPCDEHGEQLWWGSVNGWTNRVAGGGGELPLIVSYYTKRTAYEEEAAGLIDSCRAAGVDHLVEGVEARGSWEWNCAMKAGFVEDVWRRTGRPVLWVDADARLRRAPDLLRGAAADFAVHKVDRWQFASGTVYFNQTDLGGELLRTWRRRCEHDPITWDQVHLDQAWEELAAKTPLETAWLPQACTRIFDRPEIADGGGPVIVEHFQASRKHKGAVSGGVVRPFRDFDEPTKESRRASRARPAWSIT